MDLIKPKAIAVKNLDGGEKEFIISRLPATVGREILAKYPVANIPKVGDYGVSTEAMRLMFNYIAVDVDGKQVKLSTQALIDNHVEDGEQLIRLEMEMLRYNTSFFGGAGSSDFLSSLLEKHLPSIIQIVTRSLQQSFPKD